MALVQATEPTGTTQVAELINSEFIERVLMDPAMGSKPGLEIARKTMLPMSSTNSFVHQLVTRNEFTGAAVVAQNDAAAEESFVPTSSSITGARVGLRSFMLDADAVTVVSVGAEIIKGLRHAIERDVHEDIMALFSSVSATQGADTDVFTLTTWDTATTALRGAFHDPGPLFAVLHSDQVRDLRSDLSTNAAALYGSSWGDRAASAMQNTTPGLGVSFAGYTVYEVDDCPASGSGWLGCIGVMGDNGGLQLSMWQALQFATQRDESRFGAWIVGSVIRGTGIRKQANLRTITSRT